MPPAPVAPIASAPAAAAPSVRSPFREASGGEAAPVRAIPSRPEQTARTALESLDRARAQLDAALAAARRGRTFTASELVALQNDAYRFSETVELASKVVDGGAQAVRQTVNSQA